MAYNNITGMYEGYIYKIYNDINGKVYIGQTIQTVKERFLDHLSCAKNKKYDTYIYRAMRKYGLENFNIIELLKIQNESIDQLHIELNEVEKLYIKMYQSVDSEYGYNTDDGGLSCNKFRKEVDKYDFDGNFLCSYKSIVDAAKCMNCSANTIADACKGIHVHATGFIWRFKGDDFYKYPVVQKDKRNIPITANYITTKVNCYTLEDIYVCTYNSLEEAKNAVGLKNSSNITNVCRGKRNHSGGFKWYYANDPNQPDKSKIIN